MDEDKPERVIETSYLAESNTIDFRRSDGSLIKSYTVDSGVPTSLFRYNYNANNTAPPLADQLRSNVSDPAFVTTIWVHRIDFDNRDEKFLLMQAKVNDLLYIQDINNSDSRAFFTLVSKPIDGVDYVTFEVLHDSSTVSSLVGAGVLIGFIH